MRLENIIDRFIFKQTRIGFQGEPFTLYKFQTMDPELEDQGPPLKSRDDPRIKGRLDRYLRAFAIDELPQIYNILRGEMALMGPRPLPPDEDSTLPEDLREERRRYKPGIFNPYYAVLKFALKDKMHPEDREKAERVYLEEKKVHQRLTDYKYIGKILFNIAVKGVRSF